MVDEVLNYSECEILARFVAVSASNLSKTKLAQIIGLEPFHPYFNKVYKLCRDKGLIIIVNQIGTTKLIKLKTGGMKALLRTQAEFQKRVDLYRNAGFMFEA